MEMKSVVGIDVAKGQSQACIYLQKGKPFGKDFSFNHTKEGFETLLRVIYEIWRTPLESVLM